MGRSPLAEAIQNADDLELVAGIARSAAGTAIDGVPVSATIDEALTTEFDVLVEFTAADSARTNALAGIAAGRHVVIGSSGLSTADYDQIGAAAREHGVGVAAVGNFALTAGLLQRFAVEAARWSPRVKWSGRGG